MINEKKWQQLREKCLSLNILDSDLVETFLRGSGRGGQKINKTASCVHLKHLPTGLDVKCQKTRSREDNRFFARRLLCEKIEQLQLGKDSPQQKKMNALRKKKQTKKRKQQKKLAP